MELEGIINQDKVYLACRDCVNVFRTPKTAPSHEAISSPGLINFLGRFDHKVAQAYNQLALPGRRSLDQVNDRSDLRLSALRWVFVYCYYLAIANASNQAQGEDSNIIASFNRSHVYAGISSMILKSSL